MIGGDRPPPALAQFPGFLLQWVAVRARGHFTSGLDDLELHPREFVVLNVIDRGPGLAQQELTHASGIDASTMVALLDGLADRGLAERRPHPTDRRKRAIFLTDAGEQLLAAARGRAGEVDQAAFGVLTAAERQELIRLLRKLAGL